MRVAIRRKELTAAQKKWICDTHVCDNCPLAYIQETGVTVCWTRVEQITKEITEYWNKEIGLEV